MGSRLGRRVIHFPNLPINLMLPNPPFNSIREFALKTIPSASKIEIRRVLESLYGFEVDEVRTLNMEGKKRHFGKYLFAKPDYKKAYVSLKNPLSISPDLFPVPYLLEAAKVRAEGKKKKNKSAAVEQGEEEGEGEGRVSSQQQQQQHWLHDPEREKGGERRGDKRRDFGRGKEWRGKGKEKAQKEEEESKFPWSSMRSWR